jgi:hypothetical protein
MEVTMAHIDIDKLTPAEQISDEDAKETALLQKMLHDATDYISGFHWCTPIDRVFFGCGIGKVVAVFLFHFVRPINESDEWLWVVVGDLPSVYLVTERAPDPVTALEVYCELMDDWIKAVLDGGSLKDVYPVRAKPSSVNAKALASRLDFLRTELLPGWREDWPIDEQENE